MQPATILGTELPRSTAIIQSLGRRGVPIIAVDHRLRMPGSYSRYITRRHIKPHNENGKSQKSGSFSKWHFSSGQALEILESSSLDGGFLVPTNDDYLMLVSKNHEALGSKYILSTPPWEILGPVMDKDRIYSIAR